MGEVDDLGRGDDPDGVFRLVSQDLIDLMAYFKMMTETKNILGRCEGDDAILVDGSDLRLRLEILAIYELLKNTRCLQEPDNPSKPFEKLLEMFDSLRVCVKNKVTDHPNHQPNHPDHQPIVTEKWPEMRIRLVRQAALSLLRAQEREHKGPGPFDWSNVSTEAYMSMVDRLIPPVDEDMDALDDEKITAAKESRNLKDIFLEKRGGVHGCKVLALLRENKLATFEKDMTTFTNELEAALLPVPRILQVRMHAAANISEDDQILGRPCDLWLSKGLRELYKSSGLLDEGVDEMDSNGHDVDIRDSPRKRVASCPVNGSSKRKRGDAPGPSSALALSKANESLQQEMRGHPGTVAEALAIGESLLESRSPGRKRTAIGADAGGAAGDRLTERNKRPKSLTVRDSPGEQVSFDDSLSVDEPHPAPPRTLQDHPTPPDGAVLRSAARVASKMKGPRGRARVPWTEEEVMHLNAAVKALGTGKWALALSQYKFQECRTSVDLKDKWRNLTKDKD
ncbi:unnamed protein product [Ascophyllum nodosum]